MHRISLHYALGTAAAPALIRNPLLDLLQAVSAQGSISAAARVLGLSYRHVWGELKRWEGELGQPLILWEKGQAARLSEFGAKLLLAERVSIRNLHLILEAVAELAPHVRKTEQIVEHVRIRMAQQICGDLTDNGVLPVLRLGNKWDMVFHQ